MKSVTTTNQMDVYRLWQDAQLHMRRDISMREVSMKTAKNGTIVYEKDVRDIRNGVQVRGDKVGMVVKALYEISGLPLTERLLVQSVETWLEAER